jgi:hypothetical protein
VTRGRQWLAGVTVVLATLGVWARFPSVAEKLDGGKWTREAEQELLRVASTK